MHGWQQHAHRSSMYREMQPPPPCTAHDIAGGTHHAFRDRGEGFCVFNDIAVSSMAAIEECGVERILVIDLDVHQA